MICLVVPLIGPFLTDEKLFWTGARSDSEYDTIQKAIAVMGDSGLVRIKIWNSAGMIIYSDARDLAGKSFPVEGKLADALTPRSATTPR